MEDIRYVCARDRKLLFIVGAVALFWLALWIGPVTGLWSYVVALPSIGVFFVLCVQLLGTYYVIGQHDLIVRFGFGRLVVPLRDIQHIHTVAGTYWNVYGFSVHQVEIVYGHTIRRKVRISPADRDGFIATLQGRCPHATAADA